VSVLEVAGVSVERGKREILSQVSLRVSAGELLVLLGPNGSGKSTLLRILGGLWAPSAGSVSLDGRPLPSLSRNELARRIAFVPQDTHIDFPFTVSELLAMGRYPHRGRFASETAADRAAIHSAAEQCDILALLHRSVETLSGGERQRVLIARSLAVQPEIILLDEPTANLDIDHSLEVLELSQSLAANGKAVVLASHDLNLVAPYATQMLLLQSGRIAATGSPQEVLVPEILQKVFHVRAGVTHSSDGATSFAFQRLASPHSSDSDRFD
jgi:iron complex transport system ATP-binding protein